MLLHILRLESVIFGRWVVIIPPDTAMTIVVDAGGIREAIFLRTIQHLGHEGP